jgi:hypothetical protein
MALWNSIIKAKSESILKIRGLKKVISLFILVYIVSGCNKEVHIVRFYGDALNKVDEFI